MVSVLVTSQEYAKDNREFIQKVVDKYNYNIIYNPEHGPMEEGALIKIINENNIVGVLVYSSSDQLTEKVLNSCPSLRVISRHGVGLENIDLNAAKANNISVYNTKNAHDYEAVADLVFAMMLDCARQVSKFNEKLKNGQWDRVPRPGVWGKKLGIVGFGRIGKTVAKRAIAFQMEVLVYDPYVSAEIIKTYEGSIKFVSLEVILSESDFVSLHCLTTPETQHMIGEKEFDMMKESAYLINSARAALVDQNALLEALEKNKIAGAAVDVYDHEPAIDDPLIKSGLDNIITLPHIAIYTLETLKEIDILAMDNMLSNL